MPRQPMKDILVFLPGITGSVLRKDGNVVWGYSGTAIGKALFTRGATMRKALAIHDDDPEKDDLGDGIVADALMPDLHLLPGLWKIDGYDKVAKELLARFDLQENRNFFRFPYDWRRDNRASARRLARSANKWLRDWQETSGNKDAKLILLAHSMGGLVSRYFLECMEGWKTTKALITFGTPYRGSANAIDTLVNGLKKGPIDLTEMARQLTSLYQLLPVFKCYDPGDGKLVRVGEAIDIPHIDAARAASALKFHREIEAAVEANRNDPAFKRAGYRIYPVVGISQETNLSARRTSAGVEILKTLDDKDLGGDGTVPLVSATPIELGNDHAAMYAATQHGSLQNAVAVIEHITGVLGGMDLNLGEFRRYSMNEASAAAVALEVEDLYLTSEPVVVGARPSREGVTLEVSLWQRGAAEPIQSRQVPGGQAAWSTVDFGVLAEGAYQVSVRGDNVTPAQDSFAVADATGAN